MSGWACIARLGGIGDNLMAASVLRPLKKLGYMVEVITSGLAHVVFQHNPYIDKLSVKRDGDIPHGPDNMWQKWFAARAEEYDVFAHLSHSIEHRHALQVDQTAFWWRPEFRRQLCGGSYLETMHDIVGVPHDFGPLFFPTVEEWDRAATVKEKKIKGRYIAWVLSGSRPDKVYPYTEHIIPRLIKELDINVVMFGIGGKQFEMAKRHQEVVQVTNSGDKGLHLALSPDTADLGGEFSWPIRRSLTQAQLADLVITPDTGIGWAVAMEEVPKIALISHASAENITKHWVNTTSLHADPVRVPYWPCHRLHNTMETCVPAKINAQTSACMADISVERLLQTASGMLNGTNVVPIRGGDERSIRRQR